METAQRWVRTAGHNVVDGLAADADASGQFGITHVFFIITRRRFSCDSNCFLFIIVFKCLVDIKKVGETSSPTEVRFHFHHVRKESANEFFHQIIFPLLK